MENEGNGGGEGCQRTNKHSVNKRLDRWLHDHLFVDDAVGHSLRSQQRAKTVAVLPDSHAVFDAKIALDDSKNKAKLCVFLLIDTSEIALDTGKTLPFLPILSRPTLQN